MFRSALLLAAYALLGACTVEQPVDLIVSGEESGVEESTVTVRVVAGSCVGPTATIEGDATGIVVYDETAALGEPLPPVGALEDRSYAFTAFFRGGDCVVTRYGCVETNPLETPEVTIEVDMLSDDGERIACPGGEACEGGLCLPPVPADGGLCLPGGPCTLADGSDGMCCDGRCLEPTPEGCETTGCGDTSSDPSNCGACGHVCPASLGCAGGLCQAVPPITSVVIELDADTIVVDSAHVAFLWQSPSVAGSRGEILAVTDAGRIDASSGEVAVVDLPEIASVPDTAFLSADGLVDDLAVASIIVLPDDPADPSGLTTDDVVRAQTSPSPEFYGVVLELVVVASMDGIPRGGVLGTFLPEGVVPGVSLHRRDPASTELVPTTNDTGRLSLCESASAAEQSDCVDSLADPISGN